MENMISPSHYLSLSLSLSHSLLLSHPSPFFSFFLFFVAENLATATENCCHIFFFINVDSIVIFCSDLITKSY